MFTPPLPKHLSVLPTQLQVPRNITLRVHLKKNNGGRYLKPNRLVSIGH